LAIAVLFITSRFSGPPLSTREKGALLGVGIGASTDAIIGAAVGALGGALVGDHMQNQEVAHSQTRSQIQQQQSEIQRQPKEIEKLKLQSEAQ
jgi:uncharacterized protein YcfJ